MHIEDVAELLLLVLQKAPAGAFYFIENGEDSFSDIGAALAERMELGWTPRHRSTLNWIKNEMPL